MQSDQAAPAALPRRTRYHLALASFADEVVGTLARLFAYVGTLALLAILGLAALGRLPSLYDDQAALRPQWKVADRSPPAFAVSGLDSPDKPVSYAVFRHPEGGRRDVIGWAGDGAQPSAEIEIYRPGGEIDPSQPVLAGITGRMGLGEGAPLEEAGLIDSKFGPVALLRPGGDAASCLVYYKRIDDPLLQISGWSCQGDSLPARRGSIACMLSRLTLLSSGNEPRLAEFFAHAELKRRACGSAGSPDWLLSAGNAQLRGSL